MVIIIHAALRSDVVSIPVVGEEKCYFTPYRFAVFSLHLDLRRPRSSKSFRFWHRSRHLLNKQPSFTSHPPSDPVLMTGGMGKMWMIPPADFRPNRCLRRDWLLPFFSSVTLSALIRRCFCPIANAHGRVFFFVLYA